MFFLIVLGFIVPMFVGCIFFICTLSLLSGSNILIIQHAGQQMELLHL